MRTKWIVFAMVVLGLAVNGQNLTKTKIGTGGELAGIVAITMYQGNIYAAKQDGTLIRMDLNNGRITTIGKPEFAGTEVLVSSGNKLYSIEEGSLYEIDPNTGNWRSIGNPGEWANTQTGAAFAGKLYSVEADGTLYETDLGTGRWRAYTGDYSATLGILTSQGVIWTVDTNGYIWKVATADGSWTALSATVPNSIAGTNNGNNLYIIDEAGSLYRIHGQTGNKQTLGQPTFGNTVWAGFHGGNLFLVEKDWSVYRVRVE